MEKTSSAFYRESFPLFSTTSVSNRREVNLAASGTKEHAYLITDYWILSKARNFC